VPLEFERIVSKCMAKRAKHRYQKVEDLISDLRTLKADLDSKRILGRSTALRQPGGGRVRTLAVPTAILAVAVLLFLVTYLRPGLKEAEGAQIPIAVADFENTTGEEQLNGLSGMLITALEQSRRLSVLTRSSMLDIAGQIGTEGVTNIDETLGREICRRMNIDVLVTASIRDFDGLYTIDLKAYRIGFPGHLFTAREEGQGRASIPGMIDRIAQKTRKELNEQSAAINETSERVADVTTPNLEAYQQFFQGEQYVEDLSFKEAQKAYQQAIALDSTFALAHYRLAYANWWGGESEQIQREQLDKALSLIDRLPEKFRYLLRAQNAVAEDSYDDAITVLKEMEALYPDDMEMVYNIGDYSFHADNHEQAERYLKRVLDVDPKHARALNHLGMTYTAMKDRQKAIEVGRRYADLTKTDYAFLSLSNAYMVGGDMAGALRVVEEARGVLPKSPLIRRQLATVRCMNDEYPTAMAILDSLASEDLDLKERKLVHGSLLGANLYMGRYRDALQSADHALAIAREQGDSVSVMLHHQTKGIVYVWGWNDAASAQTEFENAQRIHESASAKKANAKWGSDYWANVATYYLLTDQLNKVRDIEDKLKKNKGVHSRVRLFMAWENGDYDGALALADSLQKHGRDADRTIIRYYLAKAHMKHGRFDAALESLYELQADRHYAGARPMFYPPSYFLVGQAHEQKGDTKAAIENYERFLVLWSEADEDLPMLREAQVRLAELKTSATQ
jgi:tetratricopeptide (TPR) repeat protein